MKKYSYDESIFENIDSEEKAYWLGFLLADGSISEKRNSIKIALAKKDEQHLIKFRTFLKAQNPIKNYIVGNGANDKKSECSEIIIYSKKVVEDLVKLGITSCKSFTATFPQIREDLIPHLIRGIWDGDGSVLYRAKLKKYPNNLAPEVQLCGNYNVVETVNNLLNKKLNINPTKIHPVKSIFLFRYTGNSAKKICDYLYNNSNIYLDRKYEKAILAYSWKSKKA